MNFAAWIRGMTSSMTIERLIDDLARIRRKSRFSELLDASIESGPQIVTRRGVETAVLVSIDEWKRLQAYRSFD